MACGLLLPKGGRALIIRCETLGIFISISAVALTCMLAN